MLGGAPFNFAYRVNSLGDRGLIVTRLGRDDLGRRAWEQIVSLGMDTRFVQWDDDAPTGTVDISFDRDRNPDYYIVPGVAYDRIQLEGGLLDCAEKADCVCYGTLSQRTPTGRQTLGALLERCGEGLNLLDINLRKDCFTPEAVRASLETADVLKLNEEEARGLARMLHLDGGSLPGVADAVMHRWGLSHSVITCGDRGALTSSAEGEKVYVPGYRVRLADPCGAGDAFAAGFVHLLLRRRPLADCCELGNAFGAIVAAQVGATVPVTPADIRAFLAEGHERVVEPDLQHLAHVERSWVWPN